jgi:hypothetical protein
MDENERIERRISLHDMFDFSTQHRDRVSHNE